MKTWYQVSGIAMSLAIGLLFAHSAAAQDIRFEGEAGLITRTFFHDGAWPGQIDAGTSVIGTLRLGVTTDLSFGRFVGEIQASKDESTGVTDVDITKAYLEGDAGSFRWMIGSDVVFWGVAESVNPVNIINQRGSFADIAEDQRLGQPMARLSFDTDTLGTFAVLALLDFREQTYAEPAERFRLNATPDAGRTIYESGRDLGLALRNTNTMSFQNGSLDYALSLFSGRDRQPIYLPGCSLRQPSVSEATCNAINADVQTTYEGLTVSDGNNYIRQIFDASSPETQAFLQAGDSVGAVPYYQDLHQIGVELAYSTGDWQFKFEGAQRITERETYFSGVIGAEYDFGVLPGLGGSLSAAAEYVYDNRSVFQPATFLDDDIFAALRYDFGNVADTRVTLSGLYDLNTDGTIVNLNLSSRLSDRARIEVSTTLIDSDDPNDPLTFFSEDDFFEVNLSYFF